MLDLLKL
jgi:dynactin 4